MFSFIKSLFSAAPPVGHLQVAHPTLGPISYSTEEDAWITDAAHASLGFSFGLAGDSQGPDDRLVSHAELIALEPAKFRAVVAEFLTVEAGRSKADSDTIQQLEIEMLYLCWPDRPDDGMIYFYTEDDGRLWRCDYKNGQPVGLGFDS